MTSGGRGRVLILFPPALVLSFYGFGLHRYFTSEDFLLIRFLGEHPPWRDLQSWTGPWLGVTVVKFYRPVSSLLYGLEIAAFGAWPFGYNVVHTLVHAVNALLVFAIARQLVLTMDRAGLARLPAHSWFVPVAVAGLFALHPLHPNAVLFGASFATVWGSAFVLASFLAYQRFRAACGWQRWTASLGLFLLALGSYETAATLPLLLVAYDWLSPRADDGRGRGWGHVASLPFFGALGLYFLLRRGIFGVFVGGYEDYSARLLHPRWELWLGDLAVSIQKLHAPTFDHGPSPSLTLLAVALVFAAPLVFFTLAWRRTGSGSVRLWLFAWTWIVISLAPFSFRPTVPGNGRFWYLAVAGVAMAAGFLARAIVEAVPCGRRALPWAALAAFGVYWGWLLTGYLGVYLTAGRTAQTIQHELVREHVAAGSPDRMFATRYPYFLYGAGRAPVAQVFHYGLRDSVHPPFVRANVPVYPLPPLRGAELLPVFMTDPHAVLFEWDGAASRFRRIEPPTTLERAPREIAVLDPQDGAVLDLRELSVRIATGSFRSVRLVVVAQGNGTLAQPTPASDHDGTVTLALPAEFVMTMAGLYRGGEFFWWVEARDGAGSLVGVSRMRSFRLREPA